MKICLNKKEAEDGGGGQNNLCHHIQMASYSHISYISSDSQITISSYPHITIFPCHHIPKWSYPHILMFILPQGRHGETGLGSFWNQLCIDMNRGPSLSGFLQIFNIIFIIYIQYLFQFIANYFKSRSIWTAVRVFQVFCKQIFISMYNL